MVKKKSSMETYLQIVSNNKKRIVGLKNKRKKNKMMEINVDLLTNFFFFL